MAIQDMFPESGPTYTPSANPTYRTGHSSGGGGSGGMQWSNLPGFLMNVYGAYKDRDVQSDAAKNLSKGYTSGQGELREWLGPYADRGNAASETYMGLADQYPGFDLNVPGYEGYDPGGFNPATGGFNPATGTFNPDAFDPSQLRDMEYLKNTPGYQFRLEQGRAERESAAATRGLNLSTNIVRDLDEYGQGMASQEYEKEYDRLRDMYDVNYQRDKDIYDTGYQRDKDIYGADVNRSDKQYQGDVAKNIAEYNAEVGDYGRRMDNYLPLMNQGFGAAGTIGQRSAELEVARGGAAATREQNQGTISNQFLGSVTPGAPGKGSFTEQLGIDNFSIDDIGNTFGNMRDWFGEGGGELFQGDWDNFWTGLRDFELGDLEGIFSDFF